MNTVVKTNHSIFINNTKKEKEKTIITVVTKDYNEKELNYWKSYYITKEELDKYKIFSVQTFLINGRVQEKDELCFAYGGFGEDEWKIYMPLSKTWRTNVSILY